MAAATSVNLQYFVVSLIFYELLTHTHSHSQTPAPSFFTIWPQNQEYFGKRVIVLGTEHWPSWDNLECGRKSKDLHVIRNTSWLHTTTHTRTHKHSKGGDCTMT